MVRLAKLEERANTFLQHDNQLAEDIAELKAYMNTNLEKLDAKCTYIERDMPSASTYKFIILVVGVFLTAAIGILTTLK